MKKRIILLAFIIVLGVAVVQPQTAYAAEKEESSQLESDLKKGFDDAFKTMQRIGLCGGAIAVVIGGVMIIAGNENTAEKGKAVIKYAVIAVICMYLIPLVVREVRNFRDPYTLKMD